MSKVKKTVPVIVPIYKKGKYAPQYSKKEKYLISVIIPIHNAERTIKKCLKSVIAQTYTNIEIILIDDGSNDGSLNICKEIERDNNTIVKVIRQNKLGVSEARNKGIKAANGDYIVFVDSDDCLQRDCIERCVETVYRYNPDVIKYCYTKKIGSIRKTYNYSCYTNRLIKKKDFAKYIYPYIISTYDFSSVFTLMIRTAVAKQNKFKKLICGEDFLYSASILKSINSIFVLKDPLYIYNYNENSVTHTTNSENQFIKLKDSIYASEQVYDLFKGYIKEQELSKRIRETIYQFLLGRIGEVDYSEYKQIVDKIQSEIIADDSNKIDQRISYLLNIEKRLFYRNKMKQKMKKTIKALISLI